MAPGAVHWIRHADVVFAMENLKWMLWIDPSRCLMPQSVKHDDELMRPTGWHPVNPHIKDGYSWYMPPLSAACDVAPPYVRASKLRSETGMPTS